jgi:hypothetical protein
MIARAQTAHPRGTTSATVGNPRPIALDIAIAGLAGHAVAAANAQPVGRSAHAACAWTETLSVKAQIRAERRARAN